MADKWKEFNNSTTPKAAPKKVAKTSSWDKFNNTGSEPPLPPKEPSKLKTIATEIVKYPIKLGARLGTNLVNAAEVATGKEKTQPFSGKFLGEVKAVGDTGKGFVADVKDSIGVGMELASFIPIAKGASTAIKGGYKWAKFLGSLAGEGAVSGALGTTGAELEKNAQTGEKISGKNIAVGTAIGTLAAPVLGGAMKGIAKVLGNKAATVAEKGILQTEKEIFEHTTANGGITVDLNGNMPKKGFVVSPDKATETRIPASEFKPETISEYKQRFSEALNQPGAHLGAWKDGDDIVLDVSIVTDNIDEAKAIAVRGSQDAIFDIEKGEAISTKVEPPKPKTSTEKLAEYSKSQGYEPYDTRLPVIDAGAKSSDSKIPIIKVAEDPKGAEFPGKMPGYKYEPIKPEVPAAKPAVPKFDETAFSNKDIPAREVPPVARGSSRLPSIKGDTVTKEANDLTKKLVQEGFEDLEPDIKASFNSKNVAEELDKVAKYIAADPENARIAAITGRGIPKDVHPQVLFNSVKNTALENLDNGGAETLRDLARSPIASQESLAGQTLRLSQEGLQGGDPVKLIARNNKLLEEAFEKRTGMSASKAKAAAVKEFAPKLEQKIKFTVTKPKLAEFINSIKC